jgi:hypothetical protein
MAQAPLAQAPPAQAPPAQAPPAQVLALQAQACPARALQAPRNRAQPDRVRALQCPALQAQATGARPARRTRARTIPGLAIQAQANWARTYQAQANQAQRARASLARVTGSGAGGRPAADPSPVPGPRGRTATGAGAASWSSPVRRCRRRRSADTTRARTDPAGRRDQPGCSRPGFRKDRRRTPTRMPRPQRDRARTGWRGRSDPAGIWHPLTPPSPAGRRPADLKAVAEAASPAALLRRSRADRARHRGPAGGIAGTGPLRTPTGQADLAGLGGQPGRNRAGQADLVARRDSADPRRAYRAPGPGRRTVVRSSAELTRRAQRRPPGPESAGSRACRGQAVALSRSCCLSHRWPQSFP